MGLVGLRSGVCRFEFFGPVLIGRLVVVVLLSLLFGVRMCG